MGWQSRLKDKPKFEKTCNKCNGTKIKRKYISVNGIQGEELMKCKCQLPLAPVTVDVPIPPLPTK